MAALSQRMSTPALAQRSIHRVSTPGLNIRGDQFRAANRLRWWELPLEEPSEDRRAASPRTNDLTGVIPKVDCRWKAKSKSSDGSGDSHADTSQNKQWVDEYARLTAYLEAAYADEEGLEHEDQEAYDEKTSVGQLLAHYDHDTETRKKARNKARRDARRAAQLDGNLPLASHLVQAEDEEDVAEEQRRRAEQQQEEDKGGDGNEGRAKDDDRTLARRAHVTRLARQIGHPFSTLRASSSVGTWWPITTHAKPAWGGSVYDYGPTTVSSVVRV